MTIKVLSYKFMLKLIPSASYITPTPQIVIMRLRAFLPLACQLPEEFEFMVHGAAVIIVALAGGLGMSSQRKGWNTEP